MDIQFVYEKSMSAAVRKVRDFCGENALILSSRLLEGGGVELTVGVENALDIKSNDLVISEMKASKKEISNDRDLDDLYHEYISSGESSEEIFENYIKVQSLHKIDFTQPVMVCGMPGSGKTLTVTRLATRCVQEGLTPIVITTDTERAGAFEQLTKCMNLLKVTLLFAEDPERLAFLCQQNGGKRPVIIDTAGVAPFDKTALDYLKNLQEVSKSKLTLVHPAGEIPSTTLEIVAVFCRVGAQRMIISKTDCSRCSEGVTKAAFAGVPLAGVSVSNRLIDGLIEVTSKNFQQIVFRSSQNRPLTDLNNIEKDMLKKNIQIKMNNTVLSQHIAAQRRV
ncbi:flagellar biosynthesis protein FlhF [Swingsia samuiensis]|uniref:SRP54-type proteins GTP-binding domain-containing protein n=1 Tax=Swingsia samuiensis TaxID=1293412 RepID=A0A4Y6UKN6_9PROT|nr:hypothetical protein [Swingsia samuiensis]QDH17360.1 hypothetical protein E3D00_07140 [Swingsia samuiensis]